MKNQYCFYRTTISPYQADDFAKQERASVEAIGNIDYCYTIPDDNDQKIILVTNSLTKMDSLQLDWKRVVLHIHPNSGYDNLPYSYVKNASYPIITGNPIRAQAVSNYILSAIFKYFTTFNSQSNWDPKRHWQHDLIFEKKILIFGLGHIGKILRQALAPLALSVAIYDPFKGYTQLAPNEYNVILLAQGLNPSSANFINKDFLGQCKDDLLLINAARGGLIVLDDLIIFLRQNPRAYAFLDVFPTEPANFSTLQAIENLSTTSHIAGVYNGLDIAILKFVTEVTRFFITEKPKTFLSRYNNIHLQNKIVGDLLV
ncbi:MAG: hypothetical protein A2504_02540 [Bdellovibrionales bacterium RIFOXYD12_FULL_39_22]|nr:MAG: hypothetical protein A2385_12570 [Bdellovibrionales bacterium RIFOXYB1_FULL_39_21]OFZ41183.1 MAG: hypothetical protein A2485_00980 [Bdellovibrionales bacterium RIFOXYC12_FULL_39_17]OFZ44937.1 MAG: hypothetical protein A2404_11725 [Bdellovibrionales bacterium RIFOXYC1_FULL_39_130]OFZ74384.1 MAG: hypothetical protein A2560_12095 [Bdellovibrionales bacterium RIFOXYD1_FULL_39_84]OFZ92386.1 MAG: hypothetical protein A2504_02540 [Bdellovibrionales bacterium RIFOXYD12_FULL_39_22]HLE10713.1 NA